MRFVALAALVIAAGTASAGAQVNLLTDIKRTSPEELQRDRAIEDAYRARVNNLPDSKAAADPWGNVRPSTPAPAAPSAKNRKANEGAERAPTR